MVYCTFLYMLDMIHYVILFFTFFSKEYYYFLGSALFNILLKEALCPLLAHWPRVNHILRRPNSSSFGMPSGHCQIYFMFITHLLLKYKLGMFWFCIFFFYGYQVACERVVSEKHTWLQTFVGAMIGIFLAFFIKK